ncbi:MAG: sugar transferase [Spirochaetales bacterium]|nr:sugar transferase [Spirochaetales bacterium]
MFKYPSDLTLSSIGSKEKPFYSFIKRTFDIIFSFVFLIVLFIPFLIIALIIFIDDPKGSPFYVSERIGRRGKPFKMFKFRSMIIGAEDMLDSMMKDNEKDGPAFKMHDDPRVTKIGHFIRKTSIDELPQLLNVLLGDMSVVGPRPPIMKEVVQYSREDLKRLLVKPGLTCIWQTRKKRDDVPFREWVAMDVEYIQKRSVWMDLKLIFKTAFVMISKEGT